MTRSTFKKQHLRPELYLHYGSARLLTVRSRCTCADAEKMICPLSAFVTCTNAAPAASQAFSLENCRYRESPDTTIMRDLRLAALRDKGKSGKSCYSR